MAKKKALVPTKAGLTKSVDQLINEQKLLVVKDNATYEFVVDFCARCKATQKIVTKVLADRIAEADAIYAERDGYIKPLKAAEKNAKEKMTAYKIKCDEAQRKAEEAAERKAQEKRDKKLARLRASGKEDEAEDLETEDLQITVVNKKAPKIQGLSYRTNWSAEVEDFSKLVKAVAAGKAPLSYLVPSMPELNAKARELAAEGEFLPGVKAICEKSAAVRTR
jgi:transposase-like protein